MNTVPEILAIKAVVVGLMTIAEHARERAIQDENLGDLATLDVAIDCLNDAVKALSDGGK